MIIPSFKAGIVSALKIQPNKKLYSWGLGTFGRLGLGDISTRSAPTQIGAATDWELVGAGATNAFAIKTAGSLWMWGRNTNGQLGIGTISNYSVSPVQVGANADWSKVSCGRVHTIGTLR